MKLYQVCGVLELKLCPWFRERRDIYGSAVKEVKSCEFTWKVHSNLLIHVARRTFTIYIN